jgi:2-keto-4-pentenoate hydratase/2-oxohepta-3-ene-1,7-dioic acid hydratase in catechol pathway
MRLMRVGERGAERPVAVVDEVAHDLSGITADLDPAFFAADGVERVRAALAAGTLPVTDVTGLRVGAPLARPGAVVCIGMNYAAHAAEAGAEPPRTPIVFYKHPNTIVGPHDDILIPRGSTRTDWEVELGVVIGRRARYLDGPEQALDHVAAYVLSNDVSERAYQLEESGGQWSKGKSCETFNPLGPWLLTADRVDPTSLRLTSSVNGEPRQDSSTADLVFDVAYLVWHLSQFMVLEPGDLLNTGTPQGVAMSGRFPYLAAGDVVRTAIDGLGEQHNTCAPA